jgi:hypothetical protein
VTRIPIDVTAPIACSATGGELAARLDEIERLRRDVVAVERTSEGLLLSFTPDEARRAQLERFAAEEKGCCQFWGFEVSSTAAALMLRWDGPATAQPLLDDLHRCFTTDEPLTAFPGLL